MPRRSFSVAGLLSPIVLLAAAGSLTAHGSRKGVIDHQTGKFFSRCRSRDCRALLKASGLPPSLAALPEHHAPVRDVSRNLQLAHARVEINPDVLALDDLRARAWRAMWRSTDTDAP